MEGHKYDGDTQHRLAIKLNGGFCNDLPPGIVQFEALKAKRELHLRKEKEKRKLAALKSAQPEESVTSPAGSTSAAQPSKIAQNVRRPSFHLKFRSQILCPEVFLPDTHSANCLYSIHHLWLIAPLPPKPFECFRLEKLYPFRPPKPNKVAGNKCSAGGHLSARSNCREQRRGQHHCPNPLGNPQCPDCSCGRRGSRRRRSGWRVFGRRR